MWGVMLLYTAAVIVRKSMPALLELELQVVVSHPMWVLRIKLESSERTADTEPSPQVLPSSF